MKSTRKSSSPKKHNLYYRIFTSFFILGISLISCQVNSQQKSVNEQASDQHLCSLKGPVELAIDIETPNNGLGQNVTITITVNSTVNLQDAKLTLSSEGGIDLDSETNIPTIITGNPYVFTTSAQVDALGDNTIIASFTGITDEGSTTRIRLNKYGFVESNRSFFSYGSSESVKRTRLKYMKENSEISNKEFKNQMEDLRRINVTPSVKKKGTNTKSATINISGTIRWQDSAGNFHPLPSAEVEIYDEDLLFDDLLASLVTNDMGQYTANVDEQTFDDIDVYVKVYARNTTNGFYIVPGETSGDPMSSSNTYFGEFSGGEVTSDIDISFDILNTNDAGQAFSLHHAFVLCTDYVNSVSGSYPSIIPVEFPGLRSASASFYCHPLVPSCSGNTFLHILQLDRYDWDVIHHEYGHYVMDVFNFESNPGGSHSIGQALADGPQGKSHGIRLAWAEGYPTYFGLSLQQTTNASMLNVPLVGDMNYNDTEDTSIQYNMESNSMPVGMGEDDELAVQRILWDIYDSVSDGNDNLSLGDNDLWNRISNSGAISLSDIWGTLTNNRAANDIQPYAEIFADFDVSPELTAPTDNSLIMSSDPPATFTWTANGGRGNCCPNNSFEVVFYNSSWVPIHRSAPITSTSMPLTLSYTPSATEWTTITNPANAPTVHWVVEGSNTTNFINTTTPFLNTGAYHSPARTLMLPGSAADIAFVIDNTSSMEEEINGVKNGIQTVISNFDPTIGTTFQLATFRDNFIIQSSTNDLSTIQGQVSAITVDGGFECPEASIEATDAILDGVKNGGDILIATDAAPYFNADVDGLIAKAVSKNVRISIVLSGDCFETEGLMVASVPEQDMAMPLAYNLAGGMPGETLGSPFANDLTAVEAFSMIADATGGTFLFIPEVNDGGAIGEQFYESHVVNVLNGMLTAGIVSVNPSSGSAGNTQLITITGSNTNFTDATALVFSGLDIPIIDKNVLSSTSIEATIQINSGATLGLRDLVAASPSETAVGVGVFRVNASTSNPTILSISPPSASQGTSIDVTIVGSNTNFIDASSVFLGSGITITSVNTIDSERIVASIEIADNATVGFRNVTVQSDSEVASESIVGPFFVRASTCNNGVQDGNEEGVDCGGDCPYTCEIIASCTNGIQDGNEEGVDCGGDCPFTCEIIESCNNGIQDGSEGGIDCGGDCPVSCELLASCNNGIQDGNEEDIDCGGNCPYTCEIIASCTNGIQDGNEEGVDCGGDCPYTCEIIASCSNGIQDGNEEDVDCGGSCPDACNLTDFSLFVTDACNCVNGVDIDGDGNLDLAEETITFFNGVPPYTVISSTNNFYDSDGVLLSNMDMTDLFNNADSSIVVYVPADSISLHVVTVADSTNDTASAFGGPCPSCTFTIGGGVPTLSQWGLIILSLLLLTFGGMTIILEQETELIKNNGFKNTPIPIFWATLFKKWTLKGIPFMFLAFGIFTIADGGFFMRNVVGTLISGGIIVYFIHFVKMYDIITKNNNSVLTIKNLPDSVYFLTWNNEKKLRLRKE